LLSVVKKSISCKLYIICVMLNSVTEILIKHIKKLEEQLFTLSKCWMHTFRYKFFILICLISAPETLSNIFRIIYIANQEWILSQHDLIYPFEFLSVLPLKWFEFLGKNFDFNYTFHQINRFWTEHQFFFKKKTRSLHRLKQNILKIKTC
jgi:hypothetical protein